MALYKNAGFLQVSQHANFDKLYSPGDTTPDPGIYRCAACGDEIGIAKGHTLPPQNHHQHKLGVGPIRWQLIVCSISAS